MNLHTPERQPHETQREYRDRQRESKRAVQMATLRGPFHPKFGLNPALGGHPYFSRKSS